MNIEQLVKERCPNGVEYKKLNELLDYEQPSEYIVENTNYDDEYPIPVLTAWQTFILWYTDETEWIYEASKENPVIIFDDFTTSSQWVDFNFKVKSSAIKLLKSQDNTQYNLKFLYYTIQNIKYDISEHARQWISKYWELEVPIPPMEIQKEIVDILDKLTGLEIELKSSLEAELEARKNQYDYYSNKLLGLGEDAWVVKTIWELSSYRRGSFPQPYWNPERYDWDWAMPFVQVADIWNNKRLVEDTKRKISKLAQPMSVFAPKGTIIISLQWSIWKIAITQYDAYIDRTVAIFSNISDLVLEKYFVYQLERIFAIKEKTARWWIIKTITKEEFTEFPIPVPSLEEQQRIVNILDKFEKAKNNIIELLPSEIEMRQKQYEYYRDKLLTFNEA